MYHIYHFTIVYENEPMYPITDGLQLKQVYSVKGWEKCANDDGFVIKVMEIKDTSNFCNQTEDMDRKKRKIE